MAIERARVHTVSKPWGIVDLLPWSNACHDGSAIGEIWYERPGNDAPDTLLLLKLLLTSQPLSIQVHPDDAYAESLGLQNGKTEAWYVLSAAPEAKVALGLKERVTPQQLRQASEDGSIGETFQFCGDAVSNNAVSGMLLAGDFDIALASSLAATPIGRGHRVTAARENVLAELDGRPAFEAYVDYAKKRGDMLDPKNADYKQNYERLLQQVNQ